MINKTSCWAAIITIPLLCVSSKAFTQPTIQLPGNVDEAWPAASAAVRGLNTAIINYGTGSNDYTFAMAYYDGTSGVSVNVKDGNHPGAVVTGSYSSILAGTPDIIMGNDSLYAQKFTVAVAYVNNLSHIVIDFYEVDVSGLIIVCNHISSDSIVGYLPSTVHIDVVADYAVPDPNGYASTDDFIVVWDDFSGSSPNVFAKRGRLYSRSLVGSTQAINPSISNVFGHSPDVAAVRHYNSGTATTVDMALITYVDGGNNRLYYSTWDVTGTSPTNTIIDGGSTSTTISKPRIDAWDDDAQNAPTASYSVYKIVAQVDSTISGTHYQTVRSYDNYMSPPHFTSSDVIDLHLVNQPATTTPCPSAPYNDFAPTVALTGNLNYDIQHFLNYGTTGSDVLMIEPIHYLAPTTILLGTYFWVNTDLTTGNYSVVDAGTCGYANAVSAANNDQGAGPGLYSWAFYDASSTSPYQIHYKLPGASSYGFRQSPAAVKNLDGGASARPHVYPNPATDELIVNNGQIAGAPTKYVIVDMAGRELQSGNLSNGENRIDVRILAQGAYVLKLFKNGTERQSAVFAKD